MSVENLPFDEKLFLAMNSTDGNILSKLLSEPTSRIRRALARNLSTPKSVLNILAYDPVLNVAAKALENPNCNVERCISDANHPCVSCKKTEDKMNCSNCKQGLNC